MGLYKNETKPITYFLCVDEFEIKYFNKSDVIHLIKSIQNNYTATIYWIGKYFYGLNLDCKYHDVYVEVSMQGYFQKVSQKFQHQPPK